MNAIRSADHTRYMGIIRLIGQFQLHPGFASSMTTTSPLGHRLLRCGDTKRLGQVRATGDGNAGTGKCRTGRALDRTGYISGGLYSRRADADHIVISRVSRVANVNVVNASGYGLSGLPAKRDISAADRVVCQRLIAHGSVFLASRGGKQ